MKTKVTSICIVLISFILQAGELYGQDSLRKSIPVKQLALDGGSGEQEVKIPLRDSLTSVNFEIKASIISGELTVELYDPNGEKYGNFSLAGSPGSDDNRKIEFTRGKSYIVEASGSLVRYIAHPVRGFWKVKIINKNAAGVVNVYLTHFGVSVLKKY